MLPLFASPMPERLKVALISGASPQELRLRSALSRLDVDIVLAVPQVDALGAVPLEGDADVVIAWHERLSGSDAEEVARRSGGRPLIVALASDQILDARAYLTLSDGWLFTDRQLDAVADVIRFTREGYCLVPDALTAERIAEDIRRKLEQRLSAAERRVLVCLGQGRANRDIADLLGIAETHVKYLVRSILGKLGFPNRTAAGVFASAYLSS